MPIFHRPSASFPGRPPHFRRGRCARRGEEDSGFEILRAFFFFFFFRLPLLLFLMHAYRSGARDSGDERYCQRGRPRYGGRGPATTARSWGLDAAFGAPINEAAKARSPHENADSPDTNKIIYYGRWRAVAAAAAAAPFALASPNFAPLRPTRRLCRAPPWCGRGARVRVLLGT